MRNAMGPACAGKRVPRATRRMHCPSGRFASSAGARSARWTRPSWSIEKRTDNSGVPCTSLGVLTEAAFDLRLVARERGRQGVAARGGRRRGRAYSRRGRGRARRACCVDVGKRRGVGRRRARRRARRRCRARCGLLVALDEDDPRTWGPGSTRASDEQRGPDRDARRDARPAATTTQVRVACRGACGASRNEAGSSVRICVGASLRFSGGASLRFSGGASDVLARSSASTAALAVGLRQA